MMISFWSGLFLFILAGIVMIVVGAQLTKKKSSGIGGLIGGFLGVGFVLFMLIMAGRLYVITGDEEFTDYLIYGEQEYTLNDGTVIKINIQGDSCMVINDWEKDVIVQHVQYGGYVNFGDETTWVNPKEAECIEGSKIFYFYEDGPPDEISVKSDDKTIYRLWLRNKR